MKYLTWLMLFIPALFIELMCWLTNPIVRFTETLVPIPDDIKTLRAEARLQIA